jgi:hypothetical protein
MESGLTNISASGAIGFTPNRFTHPPIVVCQVSRNPQNAFHSSLVHVYVTSVSKDSFSYVTKGRQISGDKIHWIAIASS